MGFRMSRKFGIGSGTVSLVVIFAVLCLVVFALLTLMTARADLNLSEKNAEAQYNYYVADALATNVLGAILDSAIIPEEACGIEIRNSGDMVSYSVEINENMSLYVEYSLLESKIKRWNTAQTKDWVADDSIDVWTGEFEGELSIEDFIASLG